MADQTDTKQPASEAVAPVAKPRRKPPSRKGKPGPSTKWKPGQSGNPRGRPRSPNAFAEKGRAILDPDRLLALADRILDDETMDPRDRLREVLPVYDRIYTKPEQRIQIEAVARRDLSALGDDELETMLARIKALPLVGESTE